MALDTTFTPLRRNQHEASLVIAQGQHTLKGFVASYLLFAHSTRALLLQQFVLLYTTTGANETIHNNSKDAVLLLPVDLTRLSGAATYLFTKGYESKLSLYDFYIRCLSKRFVSCQSQNASNVRFTERVVVGHYRRKTKGTLLSTLLLFLCLTVFEKPISRRFLTSSTLQLTVFTPLRNQIIHKRQALLKAQY